MENLKTKEEILSEYFLVETKKTDEMKGWKVVGTIEGCVGQSVSPLLEFKTDGDGWLCDFKIKLLHCGLVLCSPEYVIDEDELVMEAIEKVWNACGVVQTLQETINKQINEKWNEIMSPGDYSTWTTTTAPYINANPNWSTTITCSSANDAAVNYATCATTAVNDYATVCASATCSC